MGLKRRVKIKYERTQFPKKENLKREEKNILKHKSSLCCMHDCEKQDVILCGGVEKDSDFMTKSDRAFHC